jgi:ABC-type nitrate/sulfonate/bicarbonate transport system permease component
LTIDVRVKRSHSVPAWWPGAVLVLVLCLAWQLAVTGNLLPVGVSSPVSTVAALIRLAGGPLWSPLFHTLSVALSGWLIGSAIGVAIAVLVVAVPPIWDITIAFVDLFRAIPAVAFVPVAILVFGFSLKMEVVVSSYVALWPVAICAALGLRDSRIQYREVGDVLKLPLVTRLRSLTLPGAARQLVIGLRLALGGALSLAVIAEMIGDPQGLGYVMISAQQAQRSDEVFAYVLVVGLLGVVLNGLLVVIVRLMGAGMARTAGEQ